MPKDEFDFEDPMELSGMAMMTHEDTAQPMAECFIDEFLRMGYGPEAILELFRNPHYVGVNMVMQNKGEAFVKHLIVEIFEKWGHSFEWTATESNPTVQTNEMRPS